MEPLIRAISSSPTGFDLHSKKISILAYMDDLALVANSSESLQQMLDIPSQAAEWMGLRFSPKKCASLHVEGGTRALVRPSQFLIQGESMTSFKEREIYQHLGTPTGVRVRQTPEDTIAEILRDAAQIDSSLLTPWQKINALNTFLIPRISFVLRGSAMAKVPLNKADSTIRQLVKKWLHLPQRACTDISYIPHRQSGANVPRMADLCDVAVMTHTFRLLTCPDLTVRSIAQEAVRGVVRKHIAGAPSERDVATLSGSLEAEFGREGGDLSSLWSRARNASRCLSKRIGCCWKWCKERQELGILVPRVKTPNHTIVTPTARDMLERSLKDAIRCHYAENLKQKPDQGKMFEVSSKWDASNHFLPGGSFTRFAVWRFIHRAQLNCVPFNEAIRHGNRDKR
ncbi:uncharacterized protein T26G10.4-like [Gopherus flavomarginatus]|uniref:uncharacterized protein T26G10.4-like n=1 Tax=Gopherus flavomarginatus TaxID=286002 RepID=UPI0021CBA845|nr:uncharacterized protein T26G10.4-like [Gopherus flavomarginatus]